MDRVESWQQRGCSLTPRFYEELNDFLPPTRRKVSFTHTINSQRSVKDLIESLGVPHTEVDLILVNGESVAFNHLVRGASESASIRFSNHSTSPH